MEKAFFTSLAQFRKKLHRHPELSGQEEQTAATVREALQALSPDDLRAQLGGTGVLATFRGHEEGPHLLFRAELDALPIQEVNSFAHRSQRKGVAHKCGHDGHMATLMGLARLLARQRPAKGRVSVLFQPAEEDGSGASKVLADDRFADVQPDFVFAYHNIPGAPKGQIIVRDGVITAAVRSMIIQLEGKTAHAGEPEHGINPAFALADMIPQLGLISNNDPGRDDFKIITPVHMILGEKAYGVAAGHGELHLTIRSWSEAVMQEMITEIQGVIEQVKQHYGLKVGIGWTDSFLANRNHPDSLEVVRRAARAYGLDLHERAYPFKWGEDFGYFTQRFTGAFFGVGAGVDSPALHNPDYDYPDEIIEPALKTFWGIVQELLGLDDAVMRAVATG